VLDHIKKLSADIVTAFVGNVVLPATDLHGLINSVYKALSDAEANLPEVGPESHSQKPVVHPKRSVFKDHIVCLEDGKSFKMLKRHLHADHDMTPEQYREKWGLPSNYPMVAEDYAAARSQLAKISGLGTTSSQPVRMKGRR
jgi:predicted transcriptional regulator